MNNQDLKDENFSPKKKNLILDLVFKNSQDALDSQPEGAAGSARPTAMDGPRSAGVSFCCHLTFAKLHRLGGVATLPPATYLSQPQPQNYPPAWNSLSKETMTTRPISSSPIAGQSTHLTEKRPFKT